MLGGGTDLNFERYLQGIGGKGFFMAFWNYGKAGNKICIENPTPSKVYKLPEYSQAIQPYMFGEPYSKRTCLWLFGLKPLMPTSLIKEHIDYTGSAVNKQQEEAKKALGVRSFRGSKNRSKTFQGIADAMAEQWG